MSSRSFPSTAFSLRFLATILDMFYAHHHYLGDGDSPLVNNPGSNSRGLPSRQCLGRRDSNRATASALPSPLTKAGWSALAQTCAPWCRRFFQPSFQVQPSARG